MLVQSFSLLLVAANAVAGYSSWAQFCDDSACSVNCGQSVSVDNPGCLNESGRQGMLLHGDNIQQVALVISPGPDCPCQSDCIDGVLAGAAAAWYPDPVCTQLTNYAYAQSFRFVGAVTADSISGTDICDPNNCPRPVNGAGGSSTTDPSNGGNSAGKYDSPTNGGNSYGKEDSGPPSGGNSYSGGNTGQSDGGNSYGSYDSGNTSPYDEASGNSYSGGNSGQSTDNYGSSGGSSGGNSGGSSNNGASYGGYGSSGY